MGEMEAGGNLSQRPGSGVTFPGSLHSRQLSCLRHCRTLGMLCQSLSFMVLGFIFFFFPLDFAYLNILLAPMHWLLGSSHSYSLLLTLNLLPISLVIPASFNYINICYSQMKKEKKKGGAKKVLREKAKASQHSRPPSFGFILIPPSCFFKQTPSSPFPSLEKSPGIS